MYSYCIFDVSSSGQAFQFTSLIIISLGAEAKLRKLESGRYTKQQIILQHLSVVLFYCRQFKIGHAISWFAWFLVHYVHMILRHFQSQKSRQRSTQEVWNSQQRSGVLLIPVVRGTELVVLCLDPGDTNVCSTGGKLHQVWCLVKMKRMIKWSWSHRNKICNLCTVSYLLIRIFYTF